MLIPILKNKTIGEELYSNYCYFDINSIGLVSDYVFLLKPNGKIYVVTDVKELIDWEIEHLGMHPLLK